MKLDPDARGTVPNKSSRLGKPCRVTKGWNLYVDSKLNGKPAQLSRYRRVHHADSSTFVRNAASSHPTSGAVNLDNAASN
jgi:hypothetical protein